MAAPRVPLTHLKLCSGAWDASGILEKLRHETWAPTLNPETAEKLSSEQCAAANFSKGISSAVRSADLRSWVEQYQAVASVFNIDARQTGRINTKGLHSGSRIHHPTITYTAQKSDVWSMPALHQGFQPHMNYNDLLLGSTVSWNYTS